MEMIKLKDLNFQLKGEMGIKGNFDSLDKIDCYWSTCKFDTIGYTKVNCNIKYKFININYNLLMSEKKHDDNLRLFVSMLKKHCLNTFKNQFLRNKKQNKQIFKLVKKDYKREFLNYTRAILPFINYLSLIDSYNTQVKYKEFTYIDKPEKIKDLNVFYKISIRHQNEILLSFYSFNLINEINKRIEVYIINKNIKLTHDNFIIYRYMITNDNILRQKIKLKKMEGNINESKKV